MPLGEGTFRLIMTGGLRSFSRCSKGRFEGEGEGSVLEVGSPELHPVASSRDRASRAKPLGTEWFITWNGPSRVAGNCHG